MNSIKYLTQVIMFIKYGNDHKENILLAKIEEGSC